MIIKIDAGNVSAKDVEEAARILNYGGLVAFPTETVYGLGGDARNPDASAKIYAAKGRPSDNPLIVHIADLDELGGVCGVNYVTAVTQRAEALARRFWPGPLTMILPRGKAIPKETTGGLDTVAVRCPSHPIARALIRAAHLPVAAPSANLSGRPSTTKAEHVIEDLNGRVDMIIDGGSSDIGLESTIIDITSGIPCVLRPGYISIEQLREVLPETEYDRAIVSGKQDADIKPKAPGMKYRHYAPKGELTIYRGSLKAVTEAINSAVKAEQAKGRSVGVMASSEYTGMYECADIKILGSRKNEEEIAVHLFDVLRSFDADGTEVIFGECFDDGSLSAAIMNRLMKAAGYRIVEV